MAVKIRLARRGRKKLAIYDVVVADERAPRDGRFIEKIGTYNPNTDPASININNDRALKWLLNGAQPTDTVKAMLSYRGVLIRKHLRIGVLKGAVTQEDADRRFEEWRENKEAAISGKVSRLSDAKADARQKAFDAETAKNKARLDAIKKREEEAIAAAKAAEAPTEEEAPVEEAPKGEASNEEAPKEEPSKEETPKEEAPKGKTPKEEAPQGEASKEGSPAKDTSESNEDKKA
jgi:small subunit ribosomal protein S16